MTRKKEMEYSTGQMDVNMKESGKMENNTELVSTRQQVEKPKKANGATVKGLIGCDSLTINFQI
jgi:hypothetical protein